VLADDRVARVDSEIVMRKPRTFERSLGALRLGRILAHHHHETPRNSTQPQKVRLCCVGDSLDPLRAIRWW
jgi:hypothetical protein